MNIYSDFLMPPFARIQWASKVIKDKYEPMFNKARQFYWNMEKITVEHGLRDVTTEHFRNSNYIDSQINMLKRDLVFFPIEKVGIYEGFSYYHPPIQQGKPYNYYGVVSKEINKGLEFVEASYQGGVEGNKILGKLLGYPKCCIDRYAESISKNDNIKDKTWINACNTDEKYISYKDENIIEIKNMPWQSNSLLRNFSIGSIFHTECKIGCEHTLENAMKWYKLAEELNVEGLKEVEMFLRMPMEWDSTKGIAYIKTPLFKASVNSNMSAENFIIKIHGSYYPIDAPKSKDTFPWDMATRFATVSKNGNELTYSRNEDE